MCTKVLECVQALSEASQSFGQVFILAFEQPVAIGVEAAVMNTLLKTVSHKRGACGPVARRVSNVILHTGRMVYLQLDGPDWSPKSPIVGSSIFVVIVIFWVTESVRT